MELREIIFDPDYETEATDALTAYVGTLGACRVDGCPECLILSEEKMVPLMMGKVPCEGIFDGEWKREDVFLNEVV